MATPFRVLFFIAVAFAVAMPSNAGDQHAARERDEHMRWIVSVLRSVHEIQPGMPRRSLSKMFIEEGGLSTRTQRTYVLEQCPYIKIDVKFTPIPSGSAISDEQPEDKIVSVSPPYLDYLHYD